MVGGGGDGLAISIKHSCYHNSGSPTKALAREIPPATQAITAGGEIPIRDYMYFWQISEKSFNYHKMSSELIKVDQLIKI